MRFTSAGADIHHRLAMEKVFIVQNGLLISQSPRCVLQHQPMNLETRIN